MSPRVNHRSFICLMTFVGLCCCVEIHFPKERIPIMKQTTWELNAVDNLGGHPTQVLGRTQVGRVRRERPWNSMARKMESSSM